jgi:hypothetical protein
MKFALGIPFIDRLARRDGARFLAAAEDKALRGRETVQRSRL